MIKKTYLIEESGFTVEEYHKLKSEGKTDRYIYEKVLFVSLQAFSDWKKRHNVLGKMKQKAYMDNQERIKLNNELRSKGYLTKEIHNKLMLGFDSYFSWKTRMRRNGYEVL